MPWYLGNNQSISMHPFRPEMLWAFGPLALWSLVWTGLALWHAAKRGEKWWFVLFFLVHTAGVLEIIYLVFVAKVFVSSPKKSSRTSKKRLK